MNTATLEGNSRGRNYVMSLMTYANNLGLPYNEFISKINLNKLKPYIKSLRLYESYLQNKIKTNTKAMIESKSSGLGTPKSWKYLYYLTTPAIINNYEVKLNITKKLIKLHNSINYT